MVELYRKVILLLSAKRSISIGKKVEPLFPRNFVEFGIGDNPMAILQRCRL